MHFKKITALFNAVQQIGVNEQDTDIDKKHIAITNIFLLAYTSVILLYMPFLIYYIEYTTIMCAIMIIAGSIFLYCIYLSRKRQFLITKILSLGTGISLLIGIYFLYGSQSQVALYCVAVFPFPFVMYTKKELKYLFLIMTYLLTTYFIIQLNLFQLKPYVKVSEIFMYQYSFLNTVFAITSAVIVSVFNFFEISFFENSLIQANSIALKQTKIAEDHKSKITRSINYSKNIQRAIIPNQQNLNEHFKNSFMLYKPKDIVSGDFPWVYEREGYSYVAAIDCTGHGVPGAMLSLIGNLLLNDIVSSGNTIKSPSEILNELHEAIVTTLKQGSKENNISDGMDIALCRLSPNR